MNSEQEAKLNMYDAVKSVCQDNAATVATINAFQTAYTELRDKIEVIKQTNQEKSAAVTTGATENKKQRKKHLSQTAGTMARAIYAYAATVGDSELKAQVDFTAYELERTKDEEIAGRCQNIHAAASANLLALADYGVSPARLTELQTAIDDYAATIPKPRAAINVRAAKGVTLSQLFDEADEILAKRMDNLIYSFQPTSPEFVTTYNQARKIVDNPTTTTRLEGTITDQTNGNPIAGAEVKIVESNQTAQTDADGEYDFNPAQFGTFTITVTKTGYQPFQQTGVEVKLGQVNELDVELVAI